MASLSSKNDPLVTATYFRNIGTMKSYYAYLFQFSWLSCSWCKIKNKDKLSMKIAGITLSDNFNPLSASVALI